MHKILANTRFFGKEIIYLTECHSTNDLAFRFFKSGKVKDGGLVLTDRQTRGRGQRGNRWYSEPGKNLTFSLVLVPWFLKASELFDLNMAISLGVQETLSYYIKDTLIKWPNDFVHTYKGKIGGMLIENTISGQKVDLSVVGLGLNINQVEFPFPGATSVAQLTRKEIDKIVFLENLLQELEKHYLMLKTGNRKEIRENYLANLYRKGEWTLFDDGETFEGRISGVGKDGRLLMERRDSQLVSYSLKEIKFL